MSKRSCYFIQSLAIDTYLGVCNYTPLQLIHLLQRLVKTATVVIRTTTDKSQLSVPITRTLINLLPQ
ncbi:hypothetical protein HUN01_18245 [Nostoc edaphicum CCNP1411]|uniref:Uncharacterized protein n=1 Tax=Nostoc edaphicum CCNP1411 TaxID=1472755 RepID=A0A7D7R4G8_9NOSO|nr:hypothetical protein [Nostoc edaphicum]QMS89426.1 hypothetical protein HUN01_18245 [Nostoc edaphicum CCNP1411]